MRFHMGTESGPAEPAEDVRYALLEGDAEEVSGSGRYAAKLASAFALVALMTALVTVLMLSLMWNQQFERYRRSNMEQIAAMVASNAGSVYAHSGQWRYEALVPVVEYSGVSGLAVRIVATDGTVLADSTGLDGTERIGDLGVLSQLRGSAPASEPSHKVSAAVVVDGGQIGTVHVWSYGGDTLLSQRDLDFRSGTYFAVGIAALFAVFFASMSGVAFANRLVSPISRISAAVAAIRGGDISARTDMQGGDEISDLGKMFDEMAESIEKDRELERHLTSDVAHELRTPLMAIQATVEAMQDGVLPADSEHLATVSGETVRLSRLVDAILELTRLERGSLPFEMTAVDIAELVESIVTSHGALFEASGLSLMSSFSLGLVVEGDPDRLRQAVGNLLSNAARYTPEGGDVWVNVHADACNAIVEVADTGMGIDEADLANVFSRFWRADGARNRAHGGLGIGLSVTKEIVDRHHGTIEAHRRPEGGSVFRISLPLVTDDVVGPTSGRPRVSTAQRMRETGLFGLGSGGKQGGNGTQRKS